MAFSPLRLKAGHHSRSLSLPSKTHQETLFALKASEATSCGLKNFGDLLLLPHIQQTISSESQEKWVDQLLDGHIHLLDACSTTKDIFSQVKLNVEELLSALRRKDVQGVRSYMASRKMSRNVILKTLKDLKSSSRKSLENENEIVCLLKETESATFVMLESLLTHVIGTKKQSGWSLVSKLMKSKNQDEESDLNEFTKVDALLQSRQESDEELMSHLSQMDLTIQAVEEELESLIRQLIKTRVSLLNIVN